MRKTKTIACLSTALAMTLSMAGVPAAAMAQESPAGSQATTVSARAVSSLVSEASFDEDALLELAIQRALAQIPAGASDFDKARILHDHLIDHCVYDWETYQGTANRGPSGTFYGSLVLGLAVCGGYAQGYQMLCERAGLDCKVVLSDTHAWNLVKVDGSWYHVDCTWDDTGNDTDVKWEYFLLGDDAISSLSDHHSFWGTSSTPLPAASSALDSCGWRTNLGTAYYDLHGSILHGGAFYYVRGDVDATTELVKWTPRGETVLAHGFEGDEDSTSIWDVVEFDGSIYYTMGSCVYRLNEQGSDKLMYECTKWATLGGFAIEGNQLFALPPAAPDTYLIATAQHAAPCEHEYRAQMKPATTSENGYFLDTCSLCGNTQTYVIPIAGSGTSGDNSQSQQPAKPAKVIGLKATAKKGAATISWSKVKGASSYQVAYKTGSGAWKCAAASAKASSKKIVNLKRGKVYQLKIRAYVKSGVKILSGSWSKSVKIRIK